MISFPRIFRRSRAPRRALAGFAALAGALAYAAGSSMPWEQPLQQILQSIEGPVAKIMAVIIIIATGLTLAFGDTSGGFRRLRVLLQIRSGRHRRHPRRTWPRWISRRLAAPSPARLGRPI